MTAPGLLRGMTAPALPTGFTVGLGAGTRSCGGLLVGASGTVLRLRPRARRLVDADGRVVVQDGDSRTLARLLLDRGLADPCWPVAGSADSAGPAASSGSVTVVVPVRDRPGQLARLLAALPGLDVVVVDDGSADPAPTRAVAEEFHVRLLRDERSTGPAAARNRGLAAARTPFVAFLDSDVVPVPGWLDLLLRHLDDPAVAVVGPRVLGAEPRPDDSWLCRYEAARSSLDLGPRPGPVQPLTRVAYLPSAALLVRRSALPSFDERMRVAEDVDLVWRLHGAGWRVRYEPASVVRHDHRTALLPWLRRKAYYGTGAAPLAQRHGSDVAPLVLTPWTAALTVCVLAQRRWSLPVAAVLGAGVSLRLSRRVGSVPTAARLAAMGAAGTLLQTAAALTRHYWPVVAVAAVRSARVRRALLVAAVAEGVLDHRRLRPELDLGRFLVARRLDDLAYGTGLWAGVLRARSPRALLPALRGLPPRRRVLRRRRGILRP